MINLQASDYFNSLPMMIQESILQSGTKFNDETELRYFVSNLESRDN